jgi:Protein of unknown function (DUF2865)
MRNWTALLGGAAAVATVIVLTPGVQAQSFLQKVFGLGSGSNVAPYVTPRPRQIIPSRRFQSRPANPVSQSRSNGEQAPDQPVGPPDSGGPYKTVCVRACDGFYFPVRHNAQRKNFSSDVKSCHNACGSQAKLFYYALNGPEGPDAMLDLGGNKYSELPHAFAYRKARVDGCSCKPDPWSSQETARHQSYADQEAVELAKDEAFVKARAEADAKGQHNTAAAVVQVVAPVHGRESSGVETTQSKAIATPATVEINVTAEVQKSLRAAAMTEAVTASLSTTAATPEPVSRVRPLRRRTKSYAQRVTFRPASSPSYIGNSKKKYIWPSVSQ